MTDLSQPTPPPPPGAAAAQRRLWLRGAGVLGVIVVVVAVIVIVVSGGKSPSHPSSSAGHAGTTKTTTPPTIPVVTHSQLISAGQTAIGVLDTYTSSSRACPSKSQPTICLESADRIAGNAVHTYANLVGQLTERVAPTKDVTQTLSAAQDLANSFEILGDAEPTQANYNQVLGHFNMSFAVASLKVDIEKLDASGVA